MQGMSALRRQRIRSGNQSCQNNADRQISHQTLPPIKAEAAQKRNRAEMENSGCGAGNVDGGTKLDQSFA